MKHSWANYMQVLPPEKAPKIRFKKFLPSTAKKTLLHNMWLLLYRNSHSKTSKVISQVTHYAHAFLWYQVPHNANNRQWDFGTPVNLPFTTISKTTAQKIPPWPKALKTSQNDYVLRWTLKLREIGSPMQLKNWKKKEESIEFVGVVFWQHHRIRLLSATFLNFSVVFPAIIVASIIVQSAWLSQNIMWLQSEYNSRGKSGLVLGKIVTITKVWLYSKSTVLHYVS